MDATIISEDSNNIMNNLEPLKKTGLGERLKSVREAMQLTEKEAAARLHLNTAMITLMENENFSKGPPAAFLRGYLRSYARLLNLSENEITLTLKNLENSIPSSSTAVLITPSLKSKKYNERYLHWLTYFILFILVMLVSVWWSSHSHYVIADAPPKPAVVDIKPATAAPAEEPNATTTNSTATIPATVLPKAPEPAPPAVMPTTPVAPEVSTTIKPEKKPTLSNMKMALPEPDIDNNLNENNND